MEIRFEKVTMVAPAICVCCGGWIPAAPIVPMLFAHNANGTRKPLGEVCPACLPDGTTALMDGGYPRLVGRVEKHAKRTVRLLELLRQCESLVVPPRGDYHAAVAAAKRATPHKDGSD